MLQQLSKFVTVIVYNSPKPPKEYKINKSILRVIFIGLPLFIILSLLVTSTFSLYLKYRLESVRSEEPVLIQQLRSEITATKEEVTKAQEDSKKLIEKISSGNTNSISSILSLFSIPSNFQDSRSANEAKIENFSIVSKDKKIQLRFDILNNLSSSKKLSGFIHIIQYSKNTVHFYPENNFSPQSNTIEYSQGESFNVARFRPVIADFPIPTGLNVWYKVYIFSTTGELISYHVTENLEVK